MKCSACLLWLVAFLALAAPVSSGQSREKIPDPEFTRETVEDAKGLQQWKDINPECPTCRKAKILECLGCKGRNLPHCAECGGKKKAKCRTCAGTGRAPDPLKEMACIYCKGSAWYGCGLCGTDGIIQVKEQDDVKCGSCKGKGFFPCTVCKGKRRLPSVRVKRKDPGKAKLKDLLATQAQLKAGLAALEAWEPNDTISKNLKSLAALLAKPAKSATPLKDMQKLLEESLKGITRAGSMYQDYEADLAHQFMLFKDRSVYLIKYQLKVLELCITRLEHNEKILSAGK